MDAEMDKFSIKNIIKSVAIGSYMVGSSCLWGSFCKFDSDPNNPDFCDVVQQRGQFGETYLHCASERGDMVHVNLALDAKADIYAKDMLGQMPIHKAASCGRREIVQRFLEEDPDMVFVVDKRNDSLLHLAARSGNVELVLWLLERGADACAANEFRQLPMHIAAASGHPAIVREFTRIVPPERLLARDNNENSLLHLAARSGNVELVRWLLELAVDVRAVNEFGLLPVHVAASVGRLEIVKELIGVAPDTLSALDNEENSLLHFAVESSNAELVGWLIERDPDMLDTRNVSAETPLLKGLRWPLKSRPVLEVLIKAGVDVDAEDSSGNTSLHLAVMFLGMTSFTSSSAQCVEALIQGGANIYAKNNKGNTPLHLTASEIKHPLEAHQEVTSEAVEIIKLLTRADRAGHVGGFRGADRLVNVLNNRGQTALDLAENEGIQQLLRFHGGLMGDQIRIQNALLAAHNQDGLHDQW
jgi:ankyrin repeat protein